MLLYWSKVSQNPASKGAMKLEGKEEVGKVPLLTLLATVDSGVRTMTSEFCSYLL